jgi:hypothetical protein
MEDTLPRYSFILFACDNWAVAARFSVASPTALASELSALRDMFGFPPYVGWRGVALGAFGGAPAFITSGEGNASYMLLKTDEILSYKLSGRHLSRVRTEVWTWDDHLQSLSSS